MTKPREHQVFAVSTQTSGLPEDSVADAYEVVINPRELHDVADRLRGHMEKNWLATTNQLEQATVTADMFGSFDNALAAYSEVDDFIQAHLTTAHHIGISLSVFAALIDEAAQIGTDADPATKRQAAWLAAREGWNPPS